MFMHHSLFVAMVILCQISDISPRSFVEEGRWFLNATTHFLTATDFKRGRASPPWSFRENPNFQYYALILAPSGGGGRLPK